MSLEVVEIQYLGSKQVFIYEDKTIGGYFVRLEDGDIVNPNRPFMSVPTIQEIKQLLTRKL